MHLGCRSAAPTCSSIRMRRGRTTRGLARSSRERWPVRAQKSSRTAASSSPEGEFHCANLSRCHLPCCVHIPRFSLTPSTLFPPSPPPRRPQEGLRRRLGSPRQRPRGSRRQPFQRLHRPNRLVRPLRQHWRQQQQQQRQYQQHWQWQRQRQQDSAAQCRVRGLGRAPAAEQPWPGLGRRLRGLYQTRQRHRRLWLWLWLCLWLCFWLWLCLGFCFWL